MTDDTKALVERITELEEVYRSHVRQVVADAATIARLKRELAEARRDAERLNALESMTKHDGIDQDVGILGPGNHGGGANEWLLTRAAWDDPGNANEWCGKSLRAAIDAAIAKERG